MELLLILTYAAICVAIFKDLQYPGEQMDASHRRLGGMFLIGFIMLVMNYNHPFTRSARIYFATTPIIPDVKGRVVEVPVEPNVPLKAGDVLFRDRPHAIRVRGRAADGSSCGSRAERLAAQVRARFRPLRGRCRHGADATRQEGLSIASTKATRTPSRRARAAVLDRRRGEQAGSLPCRRGRHAVSDCRAEQARITYQSQIDGVHTSVARLRAELRDADTIWS